MREIGGVAAEKGRTKTYRIQSRRHDGLSEEDKEKRQKKIKVGKKEKQKRMAETRIGGREERERELG